MSTVIIILAFLLCFPSALGMELKDHCKEIGVEEMECEIETEGGYMAKKGWGENHRIEIKRWTEGAWIVVDAVGISVRGGGITCLDIISSHSVQVNGEYCQIQQSTTTDTTINSTILEIVTGSTNATHLAIIETSINRTGIILIIVCLVVLVVVGLCSTLLFKMRCRGEHNRDLTIEESELSQMRSMHSSDSSIVEFNRSKQD